MLWTTVRKFANALAALLVIGILAIPAASTVVPRLTGTTPLAVLTGSMSPTIPEGSMVFVKSTDPATLEPGDVITWQARPGEATYITHRIVEVDNDGGQLQFITKGDANKGPDVEPVMAGMVRGTVEFHAPYIGRIGDAIRGPAGIGIGIALGGVCLFVWLIGQLLTPGPSEEEVAPAT